MKSYLWRRKAHPTQLLNEQSTQPIDYTEVVQLLAYYQHEMINVFVFTSTCFSRREAVHQRSDQREKTDVSPS